MADRYALLFVPATLVAAGFLWAASGDPTRALAVLVVATLCPLLLAAPIAIVSGLSRAAHCGILIKGGAPLELLAKVETVHLDKTGTLTVGRPDLTEIRVLTESMEPSELLRLAASLDQVSPHVLATALVRTASPPTASIPSRHPTRARR